MPITNPHRPARGLLRVLTLAVAALAIALLPPATLADLDPSIKNHAGDLIREITLAGNTITKDYVIGREIWSDEGKPLDPELVRGDLIRLENISLFGSVVATATPRDGGVVLNFEFTEMPWVIPYPALSYNEQNGFSIGLGVTSPNFLGHRVQLSTSVLVGGTTTFSFAAKYPWITGNHVSAGLNAWHKVRQNVLLDFEETTDLLQFKGGRYLGQNGRMEIQLGHYWVKSDKDSITLSPDNLDKLLNAGAALGYDSRDSWRIPHHGWHNAISGLYIGGTANTWTMQVDIRRYEPLGTRHTLATGPLLSLQSGEVGVEIPSYLQYFLGGANSIRGYELEVLGKELFGKNQLLYTLEYRLVLKDLSPYKIINWTFSVGFELAAFGDIGVAWSRAQDLNMDRTRYGYGAGLRVLLPSVECLRFDVGVSQFGDVVFIFGVNSVFDARAKRVR